MTPREEVLKFVASMSNLNRAAFALAVARYAERRALERAAHWIDNDASKVWTTLDLIRALPSEYG